MGSWTDVWLRARDTFLEQAPQLFVGLMVLFVGLFIARLAARGTEVWLRRHNTEVSRRRPSKIPVRLVRGAISILAMIMALQVVGLTRVAASLLATGGLLAIVLGFAFKEIGENLLAGILLSFSRSFDVGDLIESDGFRGTVREIRFHKTTFGQVTVGTFPGWGRLWR